MKKTLSFLLIILCAQTNIAVASIEEAIKNNDILSTINLVSTISYNKEQLDNIKKLAQDEVAKLESKGLKNSPKSLLRLGLGGLATGLGGYFIYETIKICQKDENHHLRNGLYASLRFTLRNFNFDKVANQLGEDLRWKFWAVTGSLSGALLILLGTNQIIKGKNRVDDKKSLEKAKAILKFLNKVTV